MNLGPSQGQAGINRQSMGDRTAVDKSCARYIRTPTIMSKQDLQNIYTVVQQLQMSQSLFLLVVLFVWG